MKKRTLTPDEAAAILGVSRRTVYSRIKAGVLLTEPSPLRENALGKMKPSGGVRVIATSVEACRAMSRDELRAELGWR